MNGLENFKFKYYPRSYQFDNLFRSAINGVSESIKAGGILHTLKSRILIRFRAYIYHAEHAKNGRFGQFLHVSSDCCLKFRFPTSTVQ